MFNTIFPNIHKEGYKFLAISIIATFIVLLFSKFLGSILILATIWVYYFFRDPERHPINDDSFLVSPADGLIVDISDRSGPIELRLENKTYIKVSIFMNVFNCHVNRTSLSGKVEEISYKDNKALYIPEGFAHGFLSLENDTRMVYLVNKEHSPNNDSGIRWDSFGFKWPCIKPLISNRDMSFNALDQIMPLNLF